MEDQNPRKPKTTSTPGSSPDSTSGCDPQSREIVGVKVATMILFSVLTIAVVGYFVGIRHVDDTRDQSHPVLDAMKVSKQESQAQNVGPAVVYSQISQGNLGPNATWQTQVKQAVLQNVSVMPRVDIAYGGDKTQALAKRAANRAFEGAPPTIPHQIDHMSTVSCTACHGADGQSLRIGNQVVAQPMSHPLMTNCTQCHVPQQQIQEDEQQWLRNSFADEPSPEQGERAFPGAPPSIPHTVWMRQDCLSCHGPNGQPALRSGHVWRTNCLQCHEQSSELNQLGGENQFITPNFKLPVSHE